MLSVLKFLGFLGFFIIVLMLLATIVNNHIRKATASKVKGVYTDIATLNSFKKGYDINSAIVIYEDKGKLLIGKAQIADGTPLHDIDNHFRYARQGNPSRVRFRGNLRGSTHLNLTSINPPTYTVKMHDPRRENPDILTITPTASGIVLTDRIGTTKLIKLQ